MICAECGSDKVIYRDTRNIDPLSSVYFCESCKKAVDVVEKKENTQSKTLNTMIYVNTNYEQNARLVKHECINNIAGCNKEIEILCRLHVCELYSCPKCGKYYNAHWDGFNLTIRGC